MIHMEINSRRDHRIDGVVMHEKETFHAWATYDPRPDSSSSGIRSAPWSVASTIGIPGRWQTYDAALKDVTDRIMHRFQAITRQEQQDQVERELEQMVDEVTS